MLTLQKLPNDPKVWEEYAAAGLVCEQRVHSSDDTIIVIPAECWYVDEYEEDTPKVRITTEDALRFHWEAVAWRYGILLED